MDNHLLAIAERIRGLREILDISTAEMARICGVSEAEYMEYESGTRDFTLPSCILAPIVSTLI